MFKNVGKKIQNLVSILFLLMFVGSIIAGIMVGVLFKDLGMGSVILGLVVAVMGIVLAWISELAIYAYGKIAECQEEQVRLLRILANQTAPADWDADVKGIDLPFKTARCPHCGAKLDKDSSFCAKCGKSVK